MQDTKLNRIGNISTLLPMYWGPDIGPVWGKACGKTGSPGHLGQQMRQGKVKSHNHYTQCVRVCGVCARVCLCVAGDNCHPEISQPRRWGCAFQGWLRTCLYWLPDCSLSAQLLSTAFSQTLPPQTQGPPLREIRQVVSWRPRVPPVPQGQCDLPPHGKTCRCSCRHLGHSGCTQTSAEKSCLCPIYSSPVSPLPFWHPPQVFIEQSTERCSGEPHRKRSAVISETDLQQGMLLRYRRVSPFSSSFLEHLVLPQLNSCIQVEKTTGRRGCENIGERWNDLSLGSNGFWCEPWWTRGHCLLCGGAKGLP